MGVMICLYQGGLCSPSASSYILNAKLFVANAIFVLACSDQVQVSLDH